MASRHYRLGDNYKNYTGMLNNVYPVKNGVAILPEGTREPKVLIEHYGAKRVPSPEEAAAAAEAQKAEQKK